MTGKSLLLVLPTTSLLYSVYIGTPLLDSTKTTIGSSQRDKPSIWLASYVHFYVCSPILPDNTANLISTFQDSSIPWRPQLGCSKFDYLKFRCRNFLSLGVRIQIAKQYLLVNTSAQWMTAWINSLAPNDRKRRFPIHFTALKSMPDGSYILPAWPFCQRFAKPNRILCQGTQPGLA